MKLKLSLYVLLSFGCFHFAVASAEQHEFYGSRRPQASLPSGNAGPSRGPAIISKSLLTDSFEKDGFYYFSFKLDGRTRSYKVRSESLEAGTYLFGRDVESSPLMVSFYGGSGQPVAMEQATVEENIPALSAETLQEIPWSEFSESKSKP
ncbi:MAG: hypothetical protein R3B54_10540 [Bdellovibrionota bacterium]